MKKSPNLFFITCCTLIVIFMLLWCGSIYGYLLVYLVTINILTLLLYKIDKMISKYQGFRIPENTLLCLGLFGGTLGAILGQQIFRHKTSKKSFQMSFYFVTVIQVFIVIWWFYGHDF